MKVFNLIKKSDTPLSIEIILSSFDEQLLVDKLTELNTDIYKEQNLKMSLKKHYFHFSDLYLKKISKLKIPLQPDLDELIKIINDEIEIQNKVIEESFDAAWNVEFLKWCEQNKISPNYFNNTKGEFITIYRYEITSSEFIGEANYYRLSYERN